MFPYKNSRILIKYLKNYNGVYYHLALYKLEKRKKDGVELAEGYYVNASILNRPDHHLQIQIIDAEAKKAIE